jgi:integrase/recombinase XerD
VHHKLEELLDQYLKASGLEKEPGSPLFPAAIGKTGKLSRRPLVRTDAADMLKRRLKQAGLPAHFSPHSFRATGITNFLENDGTLEAAQRIAGHADSRTMKFYDRRGQKVLLEDRAALPFSEFDEENFKNCIKISNRQRYISNSRSFNPVWKYNSQD